MTDTATNVTSSEDIAAEIAEKDSAIDATIAEIEAEDAAAAAIASEPTEADPTHDHDPAALADAADKTGVTDGDGPAKAHGKVKSGADRRPRGWLETDVKAITDAYVQGQIDLGEGKFLTPHRLALLVKERDSLDEAPSTGACAAVLDRWVEYGFCDLHETPKAFKDYTEAGRTEGLTALKEKRSADRKATRAAAKEAEKAAAAPAPADPAPADAEAVTP